MPVAGSSADASGQAANASDARQSAGASHPQQQPQQRKPASAAAVSTAPPGSEATGVCGTSFYISPEISNGWASYDEKVDLFSLGVVVFEMWHPFSTGMERVVMLGALRESGKLPERWEQDHPKVAALIRQLMAPNPADRPSAREVLRSELLPPRVEDEQLEALLRSLPDDADMYDRVVDAIFAKGSMRQAAGSAAGLSSSAADLTSGMLDLRPDTVPVQQIPGGPVRNVGSFLGDSPCFQAYTIPVQCLCAYARSTPTVDQDQVIKTVRGVFELHGAGRMVSCMLGFASDGMPPGMVRMLTPAGLLVAARYEMRQPFVLWLASQAVASLNPLGQYTDTGSWESMKRYDVAPVMRPGRGRGLPNSYLQVVASFGLEC
eukprot:366229-Chlamydomonas_euryale.AAC.14